MTQGHGHGQVHKPRHAKAREKAIHGKAQKPPSHGATPHALEKAVRGQRPHGSSRHRVEKQLQHEKEKRGQSTAPNKLEKALRGHGLHRSEKRHKQEQQHEQHRGEETPNKLEKAVREHASQGNEQPQHAERQDSTSQANRNAHRMSLRELGSHGPEKTPHILLESFREDFSQGSQQQQAHDKSLPSEKQRDKQAPGTLEKRSGEKPQPSHDKSDAQERRSSVRPPNAVDQTVRAHRDETKKDDPTRSHHDQTISAKEREERLRIATPADGVGFQFGSAQLNPGRMERWYGNLQESERAALSDPNAHVLIMTSASRPGSDSYNKQLSFERGNAVLQWLQDHGVRAHIDIYPVGEDLAKKAGKPDGVDDASDRVARIEIIPSFTPKEGVEKILGQAPQPTKENKTLKAGRELFDIAKDTGKGALKSPETAPEEILKGIGKAVKWMAEHTLQDISEARIEREISSNFIPAFRGEIERLTESRQQHFPIEDNVFAQMGRETARQIWDNLPIGTQDGLKILDHSDQGDAFRKQLGEAMQNQYISKDIKYLNQDLHFNIP
jgi:outer membrane protein OmpA-like peptidoglycan-associated protein